MQRTFACLLTTVLLAGLAGCQSGEKKPAPGTVSRDRAAAAPGATRTAARPTAQTPKPPPRKRPRDQGDVVRRVVCVYDQKPWLNLDTYGDRDPEGIKFRVFLDTGANYGVLRDGTIHVDMYKITRVGKDKIERTLVSDWHYPTSEISRIKNPGMLGPGYFLHLVWASKDIAGSEVEIIVRFEDEDGNVARSGTKRLTIPKYTT